MKKPFKPTYLYIKTHNVTGLKYFGKMTTNRKQYRGSGTYWLRHIGKYGYDVNTEVLGYFTDEISCVLYALEFSRINDIVDSKEWANLYPENGLNGGDTFSHRSQEANQSSKEKRKITFSKMTDSEKEEIRRKNSEGVKKYIAENKSEHSKRSQQTAAKRKASGNDWHSPETRVKISESNKSRTDEVKKKISKTLTGRKNPKHSAFMKTLVGVDNKNTRIFTVIAPDGNIEEIIGCKQLRKFCVQNTLAYESLLKYINLGRVETMTAKRPRIEMRNIIGYEIKESA